MKSTYFCGNCKQYHTSCLKENQSQVSSINYLRFSDLFNAQPKPHLQNFTPNAKRVDYSRFVYEEDSRMVGKSRGIGRSRKEYNIPTGLSQSRLTGDGSHIEKTEKKANKIIGLTSKKMKTEYNQPSTNILGNMSIYSKKSKQPPTKKQKCSFQMAQKIPKTQTTSKQKIALTQNTTQPKNTRTPTKNSYVYGDSNRKILKPRNQIPQFNYGQLVQSHQEDQELQFLQPPPLEQSTKKLQYTIKINGRGSLNQNHNNSSKKGKPNTDHLDQMSQLKQLLNSNTKNYTKQTQQKNTLTQPNIKINKYTHNQQNHDYPTQQKYHQHVDISTQSRNLPYTSTSYMVDKSQEVSCRKRKEIYGKNQCQQKEICRYLDNRCLGLGYYEDGEINFGQPWQELL